VSLALYRRYRPETFAEVIGQEHVTEPLQQAIRNSRVHHAYLFSGPRGCGKTTSARILARALNCEVGPTPQPCGECRSCLDLARGGAGSLDVVEIDAASHGGVDDARDLRERAFFAPASSRYKIYIIDEAHMVTTAGFNALLKVVEEPPDHLKFVFATTEPDKLIPTIRSRTHHYPFRLVPPSVLRDYLTTICEREGVAVEPGVLPLVVRSGAGSVRDSLSVLDQLIAGAGKQGVTYALATALLGYTDAQLLDDVVDAFAAGDGAAVFEIVDRVIEGGYDPRRFVQDLLERLRDLVILAAVPDAGAKGLIDAPEDQIERMGAQSARFGPAELSRAADLVNDGLTEMRGTTAPRLQLELVCARVLLPGASDGLRDLHVRLDRLERRLSIAGGPAPLEPASPESAPPTAPRAARPAPAPPTAPRPAPAPRPAHAPRPAPAPPTAPRAPRPAPETKPTPAHPPARSEPIAERSEPRSQPQTEPRLEPEPATAFPVAPAAPLQPMAPASADPVGLDLTGVRRMWPEILDAVKNQRRFPWMMLVDGVQLVGLDGGTLALAFANEGKRKNFLSSGSDEILRQALIDVLGVDWRIDAVLDPGRAGVLPSSGKRPSAAVPASPVSDTAPPAGNSPPPFSNSPPPFSNGPQPFSNGPQPEGPGAMRTSAAPTGPGVPSGPAGATGPAVPPAPPASPPPARSAPPAPEYDTPEADDPDADDSGLSGRELLVRELGASVIEEIEHK